MSQLQHGIEESGKGYVVTSVGKEAGEIPYTAYFSKKSYIEENSEVIQKFTNAIYKGQQFVKKHSSQEIAEVIQEFFPDTELSMLVKSVESYRNINAWNENPIMTEESFELLQNIIYDAGELEKKAEYSDVVNNEFAIDAIENVN